MVNLIATRSNLHKAAFRNIRTCLVSNVTDVGTRVYSSYPLTNINYPLITISNGSREITNITLSLVNEDSVIVLIKVFSKTSEKLDTYVDEIWSLIEGYRNTFKSYNLELPLDGIDDVDDFEFTDLKNNRIHAKTIAVTLRL